MSEESTLATLITDLALAEQRPATNADAVQVVTLMQHASARPGGLEQLVQRFAHSPVPVLARSLAFLLAQAASLRVAPAEVAPLVWSAIAALCTDDDWTRVNLLSAVQVLGSRDVLPAMTEPTPAGLGAFLIDVLQRGEDVLDAAMPALASLDAHGVLERVDPVQLGKVRGILATLAPPRNPFTRGDLEALRERLSASH